MELLFRYYPDLEKGKRGPTKKGKVVDPVYAGLSTKRSGAHGIFLVSVRMVPVDRVSVDRVSPFSFFFILIFCGIELLE